MTAASPLPALGNGAAEEEGSVAVRAPAVGILRGVPAEGTILASGQPFARLQILGVMHPLVLPDGLAGEVISVEVEGSGRDAVPVEYGQAIVRIAPPRASAPAPATRAGSRRSRPAVRPEDLPPGSHAVVCPADGVFYRAPRPSDPPYVSPGDKVRAGQTLALIEAMKSFSAITYGGPGLPEEAEVTEIRSEDASEVRHGQVLFVVRDA